MAVVRHPWSRALGLTSEWERSNVVVGLQLESLCVSEYVESESVIVHGSASEQIHKMPANTVGRCFIIHPGGFIPAPCLPLPREIIRGLRGDVSACGGLDAVACETRARLLLQVVDRGPRGSLLGVAEPLLLLGGEGEGSNQRKPKVIGREASGRGCQSPCPHTHARPHTHIHTDPHAHACTDPLL